MKKNAFGEQTIETDGDWSACEDFCDGDIGEMHAAILLTGESDPAVKYHAEIRTNEHGDTVAYVRGFPTKDEVRAFIANNAPELEISDEEC